MTTVDDDGCGLRERKKRMTRSALRDAAVRLFGEHGPEAVTVEDICAAAGVSPRTFFNYFASKEETVLPFTADTHDRLLQDLRQRPAGEEPLPALHTVLRAAVSRAMLNETWQEEARLLRVHPQLLHRGIAASRSTQGALATGVAERTARDTSDPYVRLVAAVATTAMRVAVDVWQEGTEESNPLAALDQAFHWLEQGLAPPEL